MSEKSVVPHTQVPTRSWTGIIVGLLRTMRPKQWTKNGFIFAALVFDKKLFIPVYLSRTVAGFLLFCLISGTVYLINDLVDVEKDRQHPKKRLRPIPSGQLPAGVARAAALLLPLVVLPLGFLLDPIFGAIISGYLILQLSYSFYLKHQVILDVLTIAAGFVLRVAAGVPLVEAERFSPWLYVCTTLLALFLGFSKRRGELILLRENANHHRAILQEYSLPLLDEMMSVVTATTVLSYALYTFDPHNPNLPENHTMMLTIPFVLYGIFRYLYLVHQRGETAPPDELLLKDRPLQLTVLLWGLTAAVILYLG